MQQNFYSNNNSYNNNNYNNNNNSYYNNNSYNNNNNNNFIRNNNFLNINDSNNKQPPEFKKKYSPTLLNKLIGLPPSHDPISLLKFKLKVIKILVICFGFMALTIFLSISNFYSRSTSFQLEHQNKTYVPSVMLFFDVPHYKDVYHYNLQRDNFETGVLDEVVAEGYLQTNGNFSNYGIFGDCVIAKVINGWVAISIIEECVYLYENEILFINVFKYSSDDKYWFMSLYIDDQPFYLDNSVQMSTSLTKSIVTNQNGETSENYKLSRAISHPQINVTSDSLVLDIYSYGIFFSSNFVLEEKTQTNFLVIVSILSDIGSYISYLFIGSEVIFGIITKLLIRDKSAWIDDDVRECIIYHSDQINTDNLLNESDDEDYEDGDDDDGNIKNNKDNETDGNVNDEENTEPNEGINDDQIELEGDNDEEDDNQINPLIEKDQLEEQEERDEDRNNYFILKDRSIK
ncbi:hypothetical protein ACTA71_001470 [Dictyostelium dimigraforme]